MFRKMLPDVTCRFSNKKLSNELVIHCLKHQLLFGKCFLFELVDSFVLKPLGGDCLDKALGAFHRLEEAWVVFLKI